MVDASWALASRGGGRFDREFMMGATLPQVVAWIGGTVIGVLGSDVVGDVQRLGLDAIFPAFFMALLVDELRGGGQTIAAALIAAALSLALVPLVPPGVPVIAACAGALGLRSGPRDDALDRYPGRCPATSAAIKALGPVLVGGKELPPARTRSSPF